MGLHSLRILAQAGFSGVFFAAKILRDELPRYRLPLPEFAANVIPCSAPLILKFKALATFTGYPGYPAFSCLRSGVATLLEQNRSMQPQNVINSCVYFCLRQPWPIERCESNCKSAKLQGTCFKLIAKRVAYFG